MRKPAYITLFVILTMAVAIGSFCSGMNYQSSKAANEHVIPITIQEARDILEECIAIHQYYADNPDRCDNRVGTVEWHRYWIDNYNKIDQLLLEPQIVGYEK